MRWMTILALTLTACGGDGDDSGDNPDDALLAELETAMSGYESWNQSDDFTGIVASEAIHGDFVQIWWNDTVYDSLTGGTDTEAPVGSIVAKQAYEDEAGTTEKNLTLMYKTADGWFWASWAPDGSVNEYGLELAGCQGCHNSGTDMLFSIQY